MSYNTNRAAPNAIRKYHALKTAKLDDLIDELSVLDDFVKAIGKDHEGIWDMLVDFSIRRCTPRSDKYVITVKLDQIPKHRVVVQTHLEQLLDVKFQSNQNRTNPMVFKTATWDGHIIEFST